MPNQLKIFELKLENQRKKNLYRSLREYDSVEPRVILEGKKKFISFACNDYLGLSQNRRVKNAAIKAIQQFSIGATSSRFITGNSRLYKKLEKLIAAYKKCDDAIVFSSGYACAIGVIPTLVENGDLIIADRLIHSCLIDGAKLSGAKMLRFRHNSIEHCEAILTKNRQNFKKCLLITETVFSMDGDLGKISEILELAKKYDCLLFSDDAHGLGIIDSQVKFGNIASTIHLQMGTLSKAVGILGGYVAGDKLLIDYLRNFSRSAIYSTALPPGILAGAIESIKIISNKKLGIKLANKALDNANYFGKLLGLGRADSAIQVIKIGDIKKVLNLAKKVKKEGFLISAIRPPTVAPNESRLRITFSAIHKKSEIRKLSEILKKYQ